MDPRFDEMLHRTWIQLLVELGQRELAAALIDADVTVLSSDHGDDYGLIVSIPSHAFGYISQNSTHKRTLEDSIKAVSKGYLTDQDGNLIKQDPAIILRVKLIEVEDGWKEVVRNLIVNYKNPNQGTVSELMANRRSENVLLYNEMKSASKSEIRIAQEFESRKVLFFPLPLAVRAETGNNWHDHREADFLVCQDGAWGILEVSYHPDRFEKDAEKDAWFQKSGVLCVCHRTAERCYNHPKEVVDEFLSILAKHKR